MNVVTRWRLRRAWVALTHVYMRRQKAENWFEGKWVPRWRMQEAIHDGWRRA